jgi:hydroxyacylglutathione hydrolase
MRLVENLYAYVWPGDDNNCNAYLFAQALDGGKHLLIDPGHLVTPAYQEPGLNRLLSQMDRDGISRDAVGLVVLTHAHPDHSESAVALQRQMRTLVAMHEAEEPMFRMLGGKADLFLREGTFELRSEKTTELQIYHSPGHTKGHITIYWPAQKVLIAGDCIFYRSTGRADLPGGDVGLLRQTIERLSQLDINYLLCGHPYGNPGIIEGKQQVQENFEYIRQLF